MKKYALTDFRLVQNVFNSCEISLQLISVPLTLITDFYLQNTETYTSYFVCFCQRSMEVLLHAPWKLKKLCHKLMHLRVL